MTAIPLPKGEAIVESDAEKAIFSKINWHILPLLLVAYCFAYIDRINVGFAQLQMKNDLYFSDHIFALGAGLFFVGYFLFEVPSNLVLEKIGARKTILRIMLCWGACATAMAWVTAPWQFYVLRFLLGAFEAGFFPGAILYFTFWYPPARRGRVIATFMTATAIAGILIGPLNGALMKFGQGLMGYHGWQWMFIANGAPCILIGVLAYLLLSDGPATASWLTDQEKRILTERLARDRVASTPSGHSALRTLLSDPKIYILSAVYFLMSGAVYALLFWAPTMIASWGVKDVFHIGLLKALPNIVGAVGMVLIGLSSDRMNDRRGHYVFCVGLIAVNFVAMGFANDDLVWSMIFYCIASIGIASLTPLFFAFVSEYLSKETAAGGIALISSLGNLGPAVTPSISTWILTSTGQNRYSLFFIVSLYVMAAIIMAVAARPRRQATVGVAQPI
ncbi:MFS transporter [Pseudomonas sp. MTM4]|uniref:MFS transporter n=1 Tax=unclassified Pseudomonas TaxID=196821 RepID=UPI00103CC0F2|nr:MULTISPECIES: MFS transporter [unclassified Pseudomonas]MBC8648796.1 MFS transporter [Pseudomonas sp. MT4]QXY92769.1 MFS transporter [Pseudomonas sp. MTM4]TCD22422.1 MFS transporter [Pseudomonas sp. IC_126]